jgi:hypothetical protein
LYKKANIKKNVSLGEATDVKISTIFQLEKIHRGFQKPIKWRAVKYGTYKRLTACLKYKNVSS